jgi:hypothetical protein
MRLPDFAIIGAQKSATTFLQFSLAGHPDVYMPRKEVPFFESPDYEESRIDELAQLFTGRSEKLLGFKRPNYLGKPEVPDRLASDLPRVRLIAILRNPVDRAVSAYHHYIAYGFIPPIKVEIGMRRLLNEPSFSATFQRASEIIEFGFYYRHLLRYQSFTSKKQFLILLYEDIAERPEESLNKVGDFLNIDQKNELRSSDSRPQATTHSLGRLKLLRFRNRLLHRYNVKGTRLVPKNSNLFTRSFAASLSGIDRFVVSRLPGTNKPTISSELKANLYEVYATDIAALEGYLGENLSHWKP